MYTDEYNDELESEESPINNQPTIENKFNSKILIVVALLIIIIGLVVVIINSKKGSNNYVLTIRPDTIIVPHGKNQNIAYDVRKGGVIIPNANVRLVIENENIASIDNTVITGLNYGKTKLVATYTAEGGKTYQSSREIVVADGDPNVRATGITFPDGELQMPLNGTYDIVLTVLPSNGYIESRIITSSDTSVVTVNNKGTLTAIKEGTSVVSINVNNGLFKKDVNVIVSKENVVSTITASPTVITLSGSIKTLNVGETATLKYITTPSNISKSSLNWKSSNSAVLTVNSNGEIKAIKEGTATITVTASNNVSDSVSIQVTEKNNQISKIDFTMNELAILVGKSQLITPIITPSTATNKSLTYTMSNTSIASVVASSDTLSATINAISPGETILTIKANNGVEKKINIVVVG